MTIAPASFFDGFRRTVVDGWGQADSGQSWVGATSSNDVNDQYGTKTVIANLAPQHQYVAVPNNASQEVLVKVMWTTDGDTDFGPMIRRQDATNYYMARIQQYQGFNGEIAIGVSVNGTLYDVGRMQSPTPLAPNVWYWVRFNCSTGLNLKIWREGTVEPTAWSLSTGMGTVTPLPGAGPFGMWWKGTSATYTVNVDTMYWYSLEDVQPSYPVISTFAHRQDKGWGIADTGHLWEGHFADDPAVLSVAGVGTNVITGGIATRTASTLTDSVGFIGPSHTDVQIEGIVSGDQATNVYLAIGARGSYTLTNGVITNYQGYIAQIFTGGNLLKIFKRAGGTFTQIGSTFTLGFTVAALTKYHLKLRVTGQGTVTVSAKAWQDGQTEPGSFQIVATDASSPIVSGQPWAYLDQDVTTTRTGKLSYLNADIVSAGTSLTTGALTSTLINDTRIDYKATYTGDSNNNAAATVQYREKGLGDTFTTFATGTTGRNTGTTPKQFTGSITGLKPNTDYEFRVTFTDADVVVGTNPLVQTFHTTNNGVTVGALVLTPRDKDWIDARIYYTDDDDATSSATWGIRVYGSGGAFTAPAATGVERAQKFHSAAFTGLVHDTIYEAQVTLTDASGIRGANPVLGTASTLGKAIRLKSISATPDEAQASVTVDYDLDVNANATIALQYKSSRETLWTTIPAQRINVDRTNTFFYTTLPNLRPNTAYYVLATVNDPDGVVVGTPTFLETTFSTLGETTAVERRAKHYVYRVYDSEGGFIGTWPDAPTPEFGFDENGGVTDLTVKLPRKINELSRDGGTVAMLNRVDIWAIHPSGDGLGPNLVQDEDMTKGMWTLGAGWSYDPTGGPDDSQALFYSGASPTNTTRSENIDVAAIVPFVIRAVARARGGKIRMYVEASGSNNIVLDQSDDFVETVGGQWQMLRLEYTPPTDTAYLRVCVENQGGGKMWVDKVTVLPKELLIYRGRIESFTPSITKDGQSVSVQVLGLVSLLSDMYISFLQYVWLQPQSDLTARLPRHDPTDPSQMLRDIIDEARRVNPHCTLYYTDDSIRNTGTVVEYTFRDKQLRACFDKIRDLCPSGWHYYIEPDGRVVLRGQEHARTHTLRLDVEISDFDVEKSVRNLKNVVHVKGRQDSDNSENDGYGSINYTAKDDASIALYGWRETFIRDSNIKDPETAEIVGEGRLIEYNREEQRGHCLVPDEKALLDASGMLLGYNIEAFRPGDMIVVQDLLLAEAGTIWNTFKWDGGYWAGTPINVLPEAVPITTVQYQGAFAQLELSERMPSSVGDFARLYRFLQQQNSQTD